MTGWELVEYGDGDPLVLAIGSYQYIFRAWLALPAVRQAACAFEPPHAE